jgi:hypothetical protein
VPRKVFQDFANTLPQMLVGWRMAEDLEVLADLPDGTLSIDVLNGTATHSSNSQFSLRIAEELNAWLMQQMDAHNIPRQLLDGAILTADIRSNRIATNRKRIVAFDFECKSALTSGEKTYTGSLAEKHAWHRRI